MNNIVFDTLNNNFAIATSKEHRPVTDAILLSAFANVKKYYICCDLCSGCGIIPFLWYAHNINPKTTYAVEIQELAYNQMALTQEKNNLNDVFFPINEDLNNLQGKIQNGSVDIITCNPPYKIEGAGIPCDNEKRNIARHEGSCTLDDICRVSSKLLKPSGSLCICQRPERIADIFLTMRNYNIEPKRMRLVQKRIDTAPWLVLIEGKKQRKPFLQVEAPLITRNNGDFSDEMNKIYSTGKMDINIKR